MNRILMLLRAEDWQEAKPCLNSALTMLADPAALSVGLYLECEPDEPERQEIAMDERIALRNTESVWEGIDDVWHGQSHVLAAHPGMRFSRQWDRTLNRAMARCVRLSGYNSLLTGMLPRDVEPVDAVCPVAADSFDRLQRLHMKRGTPLRYAREPVPGAFVNPDFCFAPAAFFRLAGEEHMPLFLLASDHKWQVYTLHRPVIHMQWQDELPAIPLRSWLESESMTRFETRNRFTVKDKQLPPRLLTGVMTHDVRFTTHVPLMVKVQETLRSLDSHTSRLTPLCVTCWLTKPGEKLDEQRMANFRRLSSMRHLPLLCYTDPPNAHTLSLSHDRVNEYQGQYGLQVPREVMRKDLTNYIKLCKPYLLTRTRQRELKYSHYIWLDLDYLRYPVYERCALDWQNVCHDRIMLAVVDGRPDLSMISIPEDRLEPLCRQIDGWVQHILAQSSDVNPVPELPREQDLWLRLMAEHPDWFEPVELPGRRELLALAMLGRGEEFHTT